MPEIVNLTISPTAAAELSRLASFAGTPGCMFIDLVNDPNDEGWLHLNLTPGSCDGSHLYRGLRGLLSLLMLVNLNFSRDFFLIIIVT